MEQQQKACVCLGYTWLSKAIASAYWDAYTVLANAWLHRCSYAECSCPEKTRFTFSYLLLLLNQDPATAIHACVTFRSDFLSWRLQKDQGENCGWFIMSRFSRSEVNTESMSHWSSVVCISFPPATELSQDSGLLTCSVQAITMTTWKYRKETERWILTETD